MKTKLINTSLVFAGLLFAIAILEIFLRIYLKDDYGVPTHRNWQFRRNWEEKFGDLNSLGHRDHEFSVKKPPKTFRILAIGDSLTYGDGIKNVDDIFTEILEKKLNDDNNELQYEVLNVSKKGWDVKQYLSALKNPGLSYEPDIVMIGFFFNDIEANENNRPKIRYIPERVHWVMARLSYAYWYTYSAVTSGDDRWLNYYLSYTSPDSYHWRRFVRYWKEILATCNNRDIKTMIVILPTTNWLNDTHPFIPVYHNVENLSKDNGAVVLNLFPFLKGYNPRELHVGITDSHPNAKAHRIYASKIFDFLKKEELIPDLASGKGA